MRRLLARPAEVWRELAGDRRAVLAERLFPAGITWESGKFSNPAKCLLLLPFGPVAAAESGEVPPIGPSANPPVDLLAWRATLARLEVDVLGRAA